MEKFLLSSERTHDFTIEAAIQGQKVKGNFTCKYPSIQDTLQIDLETNQRIGGADLDSIHASTYELAYAISYCETLLIDYPEWFNLDIIDDREVIYQVMLEIENFRLSVQKGDGTGESKADSSKAGDEETLEVK